MVFSPKTTFISPATFSERDDGFNIVDCRDGGDAVAGAFAIMNAEVSHTRQFFAIIRLGQQIDCGRYPKVVFCAQVESDLDEEPFLELCAAARLTGCFVDTSDRVLPNAKISLCEVVIAGGVAEWARAMATKHGVRFIEY